MIKAARQPERAGPRNEAAVAIRRVDWRPYLLQGPVVALLVVVVLYPIAYSFWLSLQRYSLQRPDARQFVWLQNYIDLLGTAVFWSSLGVTLVFVFASVVLILACGLGLALIANLGIPGRGILRALLVVPWAIPSIVNGIMWQWVFNAQVGVFNGLLVWLGILDAYRPWLSDPGFALAILVVAHVWNFTPFTAIFLLASLQSIPSELHEAAAVDGANAITDFLHITLPWLIQPLLIIGLLQTIYALKVFDLVYVLTGGGPGNATSTLSWLAYTQAFQFLNFGSGNAHAYVITILGLIPAILYTMFLFRHGEVEV